MIRSCLALSLLLPLLVAAPRARQQQQQQPETAPPPPPATVPELTPQTLENRTTEVFVVTEERGRGLRDRVRERVRLETFDPSTHDELNRQLMSNRYVAELRRALWLQDTAHQFESKAHFDNCDFDGATAYLEELLRECDSRVAEAERHRRTLRRARADASVRRAFFALGQALHAVQDFYAHSNFVELMEKDGLPLAEIAPVPFWTAEGREQLGRHRARGLVTGYVFWGFPQRCEGRAPSHAELAKDKGTTDAGKIIVPRWGVTQYHAAYQLALRASSSFLGYAFGRWPLLKERAGGAVAFEVFQERRSL